ncbi:PRC-barrel domain-containing protein [Mesorhizobium sp. YIM 152430]|uniref:PRC-barrel domain-containing protein n=1 Tax=Mesorhizobium sp. YIM 152430 TaxID=3031761 RepID=UPI0023DAE978|nr:PRC-barrel domain-containing protein [Mesorhizobium sp. YIM 152430]MDF1598211.1 PRC-barrel domain-containing protein [Mesorhizobium sp. YIM 152430]
MIRTLLATTAIATLLSTGAFAQTMAPETTDPGMTPAPEAPAEAVETPGPQPIEGHLASNIIGENVYNGVGDDAENIGTVNDIVLDANGQASLVVVGVGGFLGLGQKDVALEYETLEWAQREDGTTWLVASTTREQLEQQEAFDRDLYDPDDAEGMAATGAATGAAATTDTAADTAGEAVEDTADAAGEMADDAGDSMAEMADDAEDAMTDDTAAAPAENDAAMSDDTAMDDDAATTDDTATAAIDRTTLTEVDSAGLSADELIGTTVYGANEENVGSINDVVLEGDSVDFVTIDVGGFLGLGAKTVAVDMDNLAFMTDEDGEMYLYTSFTQEQLEAQPEYDEATFADARDEQLLVNPAN